VQRHDAILGRNLEVREPAGGTYTSGKAPAKKITSTCTRATPVSTRASKPQRSLFGMAPGCSVRQGTSMANSNTNAAR